MNILVGNSSIHGLGVFAIESIEEGDWQYVYGYLKPCEPGSPIDQYTFEWDTSNLYMPYPPWCYLNHSNEPNCEIDCLSEDPLMLTIEALRH